MQARHIPSGASAQLIITAVPALDRDGNRIVAHFDALLDGRVLVAAIRQPFLDVARALIEEGHDPDRIAVVVRAANPGRICIRARIGVAAGLTVKEPDRGCIHLAPWKAFSPSPVEPPIEFKPDPARKHRPALAATSAGAVS
jgi:hypothetical protein